MITETAARIQCPNCCGLGVVEAITCSIGHGCRTGHVPCSFCRGERFVTAAQIKRAEVGQAHRDARVAAGKSQADIAAEYGVGRGELSRFEHRGEIESDALRAALIERGYEV